MNKNAINYSKELDSLQKVTRGLRPRGLTVVDEEEHKGFLIGYGNEENGNKVVLLEMDSVAVTVPLRPPLKKMKKRKELDALAPPHAVSRRSSGKRSSQVILWFF